MRPPPAFPAPEPVENTAAAARTAARASAFTARSLRPAPPSRRARVRQRRQHRLELLAQVLERGRQREPLAEVLERLVGGEAGADGRDLEQDAARLAKVDRAGGEPLDDRRRGS